MVCSPPNVQEVCVELEIKSFTNNQVLSPTISQFLDDLINNIFEVVFSRLPTSYSQDLAIKHFVHQLHNITLYIR